MQKTNTSLQTIFTLVNSMVGGAMLTFPVLFKSAGLVISSIILLFSGAISFITCRIYVFHTSQTQNNVEDTIRRLLGKKWQSFFRLITGFYLMLLNIIYIDLIVDQTYGVILFIMQNIGAEEYIADKTVTTLVFDKFSIQYLTLIYFIPLLLIIFIKNMNLIIKLAQYGVYSAFIYFIFIIYQLISNLAEGDVDFADINYWSWDIGNLSGGCALAFTVHTVVTALMKPNINQDKNVRDLGLSYLLGFCLYIFIGNMGAIAISNKQCEQTLVNCYIHDWQVLFVQISYLFGRITVFPITLQICRTRLLNQFYPKVTPTNFRNFNIIFMIIGSLFSFFSPYLPIDLLMNIVGAIVCYIFIYLIPTFLHHKCLYYKKLQTDESLIQSITSLEEQTPIAQKQCCPHAETYASSKPKIVRFIFYGIINIIGIAIAIYGLYSTFQQFSKH